MFIKLVVINLTAIRFSIQKDRPNDGSILKAQYKAMVSIGNGIEIRAVLFNPRNCAFSYSLNAISRVCELSLPYCDQMTSALCKLSLQALEKIQLPTHP